MKDISLTKEEFKLFNQDDQFGFFYDDEGWPKEDADIMFDSEVDKVYKKYDFVVVDIQDNIFGLNDSVKEVLMQGVIEAYDIAKEVKEG